LGGYYYTVAALPYLSFDSSSAMAQESFLCLCQNTLSGADWNVLRQARFPSILGPKTGNATFDNWAAGEQSLRAELAKLRATKKGLETESYNRYRAHSQSILDAARKAFGEDSPLDAEMTILRALWTLLGELETGHLFDVDKLIVYYLKMQIIRLKNKRNKIDGEKNFSFLYDMVVNKKS